jgi:NitT/TauT family transport system substrate-binding protein
MLSSVLGKMGRLPGISCVHTPVDGRAKLLHVSASARSTVSQWRPSLSPGRLLVAAPLLLLVLALGCSAAPPPRPSPPDAASPAAPAPPVLLRVAYASTGLSQGYVWVAQDAGYFAAEGLDVELQYVPGSNVAIQSLLAGELQFIAGGGSTSVGAAIGGADTVLLATTTGTFVITIAGTPDLTPTADSVRGHTLGVTRIGSTSDFVARYWLRSIGLQPVVDVPILQAGGNAELVAALSSGAMQLVSLTDLFGLDVQRQGYRELADMGSLGIEYVNSGITTRRAYLADHEDVVRRYVRAAVRGHARFVTDEALGVRVVGEYARLEDREVLTRAWERYATRYAKRIPYTSPSAVRLALEELALTDDRARTAEPEQFYDNRYIRELDDAGLFATLYPP